MGYLTLSPGIAVLSLAVMALGGCVERERAADLWPPEPPEIVECPGDPRCGRDEDPERAAGMCTLVRTRVAYKCGEAAPYLPCPGAGCPTGEPGIPAQKCWVSLELKDMRCPPTPGPTPAPAPAPEPAPAPAAAE